MLILFTLNKRITLTDTLVINFRINNIFNFPAMNVMEREKNPGTCFLGFSKFFESHIHNMWKIQCINRQNRKLAFFLQAFLECLVKANYLLVKT